MSWFRIRFTQCPGSESRWITLPFPILLPPTKSTILLDGAFCWWGKVDSNHRRHCQQIYSRQQAQCSCALPVLLTTNLKTFAQSFLLWASVYSARNIFSLPCSFPAAGDKSLIPSLREIDLPLLVCRAENQSLIPRSGIRAAGGSLASAP